MRPVIEAATVVKRYGAVEALAGLDLVVEAGGLVALLGPNGAGKTTLVHLLATLIRPDEGTLHVGGHDVVQASGHVRRQLGFAGQHAAVEGALTGRENLEMIGRLYGLDRVTARERARETIDRLALEEVVDRRARTYSGGQRRRLDLGASLVGAPRLLLLDEPTTGLDPRSRIQLWDAIRELSRHGTDVLLTTQYLDEADQLASRIVIIDQGQVIADGTSAELKAKVGRDVIEVHVRSTDDLPVAVDALRILGADGRIVDRDARRISLPVSGGSEQLTAAIRALDDAAVTADDITLRRPTLDEVFLELTGTAPGPDGGERQWA